MSDWKATFRTAAGVLVAFDDLRNGVQQTGPILGADMPAFNFVANQIFDQPGEIVTKIQVQPREVTVPIAVMANDGVTLRERVRSLTQRLSPLRGEGVLTLTRGTGKTALSRSLNCNYKQGLEGQLETYDFQVWQEQALVFRASSQPFFYDTTPTLARFVTEGDTGTPFFPLFTSSTDMMLARFGTSTIFGDVTITNTGDVEAWPVITLTGPLSSPVVTNVTTGKTLDLGDDGGFTLAAGDTAVIDTRPLSKTITLSDGTNLMHYATDVSELWPLVLGANTIHIEGGSATGETAIDLSVDILSLAA